MPHGFFLAAGRQIWIAVEQVLDDQVHLQGEFPVLILLVPGLLQFGRILVKAFPHVLLTPGFQPFQFLAVIDAEGHAADDFHLVHRLDPHAEIFLNKL